MPEEQTQVNEMIHYALTLLPHLRKKMLKKLNTYYRLKTLREAMDVTMEFKVEHQIAQLELDLTVMETCYEEPKLEESRRSPDEITNSETRLQPTRKVNLSSRSKQFSGGDVTTIIAGMDDNVSDEDLKEEINCYVAMCLCVDM